MTHPRAIKGETIAIKSKEEGKDQESIQSSTTPDTGHHMAKWQNTREHHTQKRAKSLAGDNNAANEFYTVNPEIFARVYFRETSHMRSFVKIKPSRNGEITLTFIDMAKSCLSREFFTSLICLLMLFAKVKFSRKFPDLQ